MRHVLQQQEKQVQHGKTSRELTREICFKARNQSILIRGGFHLIYDNEFQAILSDEEMARNINRIRIDTLQQFVKDSIQEHGSAQKLVTANRVCDTVIKMLEKQGQIQGGNEQSYIQAIVAAALIHNLFYDGTFPSVFLARQELTSKATSLGIPSNYTDAIFQMVECQLGYDMPVPKCRPTPGHPEELFAWACWFIEELHGGKKMPNLSPKEEEKALKENSGVSNG